MLVLKLLQLFGPIRGGGWRSSGERGVKQYPLPPQKSYRRVSNIPVVSLTISNPVSPNSPLIPAKFIDQPR